MADAFQVGAFQYDAFQTSPVPTNASASQTTAVAQQTATIAEQVKVSAAQTIAVPTQTATVAEILAVIVTQTLVVPAQTASVGEAAKIQASQIPGLPSQAASLVEWVSLQGAQAIAPPTQTTSVTTERAFQGVQDTEAPTQLAFIGDEVHLTASQSNVLPSQSTNILTTIPVAFQLNAFQPNTFQGPQADRLFFAVLTLPAPTQTSSLTARVNLSAQQATALPLEMGLLYLVPEIAFVPGPWTSPRAAIALGGTARPQGEVFVPIALPSGIRDQLRTQDLGLCTVLGTAEIGGARIEEEWNWRTREGAFTGIFAGPTDPDLGNSFLLGSEFLTGKKVKNTWNWRT